jgi:hypothetical protein
MRTVTVATRTRRATAAWVAPAATAAAGLAALAYVGLRDPSSSRGFVPCPFHSATGLWCPGCGMTRGVHKLLHGDVLGALGSNLLLPLALGLGVWLWLSWLWPALGRGELPTLRRVPRGVWVASLVLVALFTVVRNLPVSPLSALSP